MTVAGEGYLLAVGTPDGHTFVGRGRGELLRFTPLCGHLVYVAFVAEGYLASIGGDTHVAQPEGRDGLGGQRGQAKA